MNELALHSSLALNGTKPEQDRMRVGQMAGYENPPTTDGIAKYCANSRRSIPRAENQSQNTPTGAAKFVISIALWPAALDRSRPTHQEESEFEG